MTSQKLDTQAPTTSPGMDTSDVHLGFLPGLVIFVHGVNSDGEWYEQCEEGLIDGLNQRLGYQRALLSDQAMLRKAEYKPELTAEGDVDFALNGKNFIADPGRSPVIRFRWGYKAAGEDGTDTIDEKKEYAGKIYLNELDAWGGGPFQNGTTALPYMWGNGLDDRLFWWIYANMVPVEGRDVYACPPRTYYAHAAHRLKELIKAIRRKQPDCPVTVVCHSQGNMVTLGAAMLGIDEGALADTYILANPPYNLDTSSMDALSNAEGFNLEGKAGGVTSDARQQTFKNFLEAVLKRFNAKNAHQTLDDINNKQRNQDPETGNDLFVLKDMGDASDTPYPYVPGEDRDNRGRVFLYCNPHDQVIGVTPVQGMGWQGVSKAQRDALDTHKRFHVRVWAQPKADAARDRAGSGFQVGSADWKQYNYLEDNHSKRFWNPPAPVARYRLSYNEKQSFFSKVITTLTAPLLIVATRLVNVRINDDPKKGWTVGINAPELPDPFVPLSRRAANPGVDDAAGYKGRRDNDFDEGKDPAWGYADKDGDFGKQHGVTGSGDASTEAGLRYEINARLKMEQAAGRLGKGDKDMKTQTTIFLKENPNATDHSTIVGNAMHARKAVAYDVALGWVNSSEITDEYLEKLRQFADWRYLEKHPLDTDGFYEYALKGFFKEHQLFRTYDMKHMTTNAPKIIDERKSNFLADIH
ncbi:hypothetical protein GmRootV118_42160 [Variovorax sp. V118]